MEGTRSESLMAALGSLAPILACPRHVRLGSNLVNAGCPALPVEGIGMDVIRAPKRDPRIMQYEPTDFEWVAIGSFLPNKPRGIPRVDDRRVQRPSSRPAPGAAPSSRCGRGEAVAREDRRDRSRPRRVGAGGPPQAGQAAAPAEIGVAPDLFAGALQRASAWLLARPLARRF